MRTQRSRPEHERAVCAVCGDVIGVYEPVLVVETTRPRVTSLAREPELSSVEADLSHRDCGPAVA